MALQTQIGAYEDCLEYFDRAIVTEKGIRVEFKSESEAQRFQMRMHQARAILRADSKRMYAPEEPQHGNCDYDKLVVKNPIPGAEDNWWVYIEHHSSKVMSVEELD